MAGMQPRDSLHPLDVSESMLLPAHQIVSPSSSISSMPSSPHTGPLTPRSAILSQGYPLHPTNTLDDSSDSSQEDLDLQMEMQLQQEYAQFSWTNATNSWQSPSELLLGNDFELSAIPPIELGGGGGGGVVSKGGEESQSLSAMMEMEYNHHQSQCGQEYSSSLESPTSSYEQGIVAFDQMMAGHGF
ncbi:hypothetical protein H0H93_002721 [Arthromyces matolae]|nr:hypothetical protein H0H93_002721 [Arthromyces matolae]